VALCAAMSTRVAWLRLISALSLLVQDAVRLTPRIETGDPRYAWLNHTIFVGEGRLQPGRVIEYKVYRVA